MHPTPFQRLRRVALTPALVGVPALVLAVLISGVSATQRTQAANAIASTLADCRLLLAQSQPAVPTGEGDDSDSEANPVRSPSLPLPLRLSTWNAMKFSEAGAAAMLERLAEESDLLLLQESLRVSTTNSAQPYRLFADGYLRGDLQTGVETRSIVSADAACTLRFREPWLRTPKAIAIARFPLSDGRSLLVVNLHAINFTVGAADYRKQLEAIGELLTVHRGPAVIAGDFNNWSDARQGVLQAFLRRHVLAPAPITPDLRSRHLGVPVDSIFLRGLHSVTATAIPTTASDHNPVTAVLLGPQPGAVRNQTPASAQKERP